MAFERAELYRNVVMKLSVLRFIVKSMSKRNKTDINRDCESFFATVLNIVYGHDLVNVNDVALNSAAIDLADKANELCFQVSATSSSTKIKKTIRTFNKHKLYSTYKKLHFLMLVDKQNYTTTFDTGGNFAFDAKTDVIDIDDVLEDVEKLKLETLKRLSDFVNEQLPAISRALEPNSLLAGMEQSTGRPPATGQRLLRETVEDPTDPAWAEDFQRLVALHEQLDSLSSRQREFIFALYLNGKQGSLGRVTAPAQTFQHKSGLEPDEFTRYFSTLEAAGIVDVDSDGYHTDAQLNWRLKGSGVDVFMVIKDVLNDDEAKRVIVGCDFSVLD